ncbi:MAG TPA: alanine racemase [Candidatus Aminicenantes bacterium]|nr:alanine racemase [Candidatus Aminicenantes bacterium]
MKRREFMRDLERGGVAAVLASFGGATGCRKAGKSAAASGATAGTAAAGAPASEAKSGITPRTLLKATRDPHIEVDLGAIGRNLERVRARTNVPVMGVVKANAYGHGLVEVGRFLESAGVAALMTGKLDEAVRLREAGVRCPIANFGPFGPADAEEILRRGVRQVVATDGDLAALDAAAAKAGVAAGIDIHVDTGMNRAGVPAGEALPLIESAASLPRIRIEGISTALTEDPEFDREQLRVFVEVCEAAKARGIDCGPRHAASSGALFGADDVFLDMVRPGIALYGYYPNARTMREDSLGLEPALRLTATITFVRDVEPGESLSYLRAVRIDRPTRVATVGIGYSDGYPPMLGGKGVVLVDGRAFPVLLAVTSNHVMIDLGDDRTVRVGDEVVLVENRRGSEAAADSLAVASGGSDYKFLIGLNPLLPRTYREGPIRSASTSG